MGFNRGFHTTIGERQCRAFTDEEDLDWCERREIDGKRIADELGDLIGILDAGGD